MLGQVDGLRKRVVSVGKEHASLCAKVLFSNIHFDFDPLLCWVILMFSFRKF